MTYKKSAMALALAATTLVSGCSNDNDTDTDTQPQSVRFATFNISFDRNTYDDLVEEMITPSSDQGTELQQPRNIAETIQRVRPDVILLNEFNNDGPGEDMQAIDGFRDNYLEVSQNGAPPIEYPYAYNFATNTGKHIDGMDLNKDGQINTGPDDALGFGQYHGQYAFSVLSRYPLDIDNMRTFQQFKWKDIRSENPVIESPESCEASSSIPAAYQYCLEHVGQPWYTDEEWNNITLASKNHADIPVKLADNKTVHFLVSHPAPPIFDNPIKHNTLRNSDEVKFWVDYISSNPADSEYIYDDTGKQGGLAETAAFVIAGDMNADSEVGDGDKDPIRNLLNHGRINQQVTNGSDIPISEGAVEYVYSGADNRETPFPERVTNTSNLHLDYVLPSANLTISGSGVFWPADSNPYSYLVKKPDCQDPADKTCYGKDVASDHRLVWVDLAI